MTRVIETMRTARTVVLAAALAVLASGCASFYVDSTTKEVNVSQYKKPVAPKPVQVLFEFQTKGAMNAKATEILKPQVFDQLQASGLFSNVAETPSDGAGLLSIAVNNVPVTDDAFTKGFVTGLTFGLAGSQVTDGYVCTMRYQPAGSKEPLSSANRHAIHTVLGAGSAPSNAKQAQTAESAVRTVVREVISNGLYELSNSPAFP